MALKPFRRLTDRLHDVAGQMQEAKLKLTIEDGHIIPERYENNWILIPWRSMKVGQSVLLPIDGRASAFEKKRLGTKVGAMLNYIHNHNKQNMRRALPKQFCRRLMKDGIRVWRIK